MTLGSTSARWPPLTVSRDCEFFRQRVAQETRAREGPYPDPRPSTSAAFAHYERLQHPQMLLETRGRMQPFAQGLQRWTARAQPTSPRLDITPRNPGISYPTLTPRPTGGRVGTLFNGPCYGHSSPVGSLAEPARIFSGLVERSTFRSAAPPAPFLPWKERFASPD